MCWPTIRFSAHWFSLFSIWSCSWALTAVGGVYRARSHFACSPSFSLPASASISYLPEMARLTTAHQIGSVFDNASGIRFPDRVESTMIMLHTHTHKKKQLKASVRSDVMLNWRRKEEEPRVVNEWDWLTHCFAPKARGGGGWVGGG